MKNKNALELAGLGPEVIKALNQKGRVVKMVEGNDYHCKDNEDVCFLLSGLCLSILNIPNGIRVGVNIIVPGCLLTSDLYPSDRVYIKPIAPSKVLKVAKSEVVSWDVWPQLESKIRDMNHKLLMGVRDWALLRSMLSKEDTILVTLMFWFSEYMDCAYEEIHITQEDLCLFTGTTRQYLKKIIKKLEKDKIIESKYSIIKLLDFEGLLKMCPDGVGEFFSEYGNPERSSQMILRNQKKGISRGTTDKRC